jgi:hypothetical protein
MHTLWDLNVIIPTLSNTVMLGVYIILAVASWYVLFTMIQQGLHQVRDMQKAQLQHTLNHVEATLGLGAKVPAIVQQRAPAGA